MSHSVHPYSHRLGTIRDWKSRWFGMDQKYRDNLKCDILIREYLEEKLRSSYVSDIEFERSAKTWRIIIKTSRPGIIIGRSGEGAEKLRNDIHFLKQANTITPEVIFDLTMDLESILYRLKGKE